MVKELFKLNKGNGFRSIGEWRIIEEEKDFINYDFNEFQLKHGKAILNKYGKAIIMKEAYGEKYHIHSEYSFCFFFMCNICGDLVYNDELNEEVQKYYAICFKILKKAKFFE